MNPPELSPEEAKAAMEFLSTITGGVRSELSEIFALPLREFRFNNTLAVSLRAKKRLEKHGLVPEQLPDGLRRIVPIIESASVEDDPTLQEMWATLLATSLMPEFAERAEPDFHKILAQLSPMEARILNGFYDHSLVLEDADTEKQLELMGSELEISIEQCRIMLLSLYKLSLIQGQALPSGFFVTHNAPEGYYLTELGQAFIERCNFFDKM